MAIQSANTTWEPKLRPLSPLLVLGVFWGVRVGVGTLIGWPAHPITFIGLTAGVVGALIVLRIGPAVYDDRFSPTVRLLASLDGVTATDPYRVRAHWVILLVGALAGGIYPTVFHGVLGLDGAYITTFIPGVLTTLSWGIGLAVVALGLFGLRGVLSMEHPREVRVVLEFHLIFTAVFTVIIGLSRHLWYPLLGL